jgi:hypothetical protein
MYSCIYFQIHFSEGPEEKSRGREQRKRAEEESRGREQRKRAENIHNEAFAHNSMQAPTAPTHEFRARNYH